MTALRALLNHLTKSRASPVESLEQLVALECRERDARNLASRTKHATLSSFKPLAGHALPRPIDRPKRDGGSGGELRQWLEVEPGSAPERAHAWRTVAVEQRKVSLELSREQALVFFEWLSKFNASEGKRFEDQAEERVLWDIEAMLESTLVEPFDACYEELLAKARAAVRDSEE